MNWTASGILTSFLLLTIGYFLGRASKAANISRPQPSQWKPDASISDSQIEAALRAEKKIEAIKLYRQRSGAGLKEAKDAVESVAQRIQPRR
jgi:ribosomal protein L7/L12